MANTTQKLFIICLGIVLVTGQFLVSPKLTTAVEAKPDLIVESLDYREGNNLYAGYHFDGTMIYTMVKNQGSVTAKDFDIHFNLMDAATNLLVSGPAKGIEELGAGESMNVELSHDAFNRGAKLEEKEYYVMVYIDYNGEVDESNEDNNDANTDDFSVLPLSQAPAITDVEVENITDHQTKISFRAPGIVNPIVRWAGGQDFLNMWGDARYKYQTSATNDGESRYHVLLNVTPSLTYHYRILFDNYYNVTTDDATFKSGVDESDLIVNKIRVLPKSEDIYGRYQIGVSIKNIGDGDADLVNNIVSLTYGTNFSEIDNCQPSDCRIGNKYGAGMTAGFNHLFDNQSYLMPGEEKEIIFNKQNYLLADVEFDEGVEYLIKAVVDTENSVEESNENNNTYSQKFMADRSDLKFTTGVTASKSHILPGDTVTFSVYAKNDSQAEIVPTFYIKWYMAGVEQVDCRQEYSHLPANWSNGSSCTIKDIKSGTGGIGEGNLHIQVVIDPENNISESNEYNNKAAKNIYIGGTDDSKTCGVLEADSSKSQYFKMCKDYDYDYVCFNKHNGEYQGCGHNSRDGCTTYNTNAIHNVKCEAKDIVPTSGTYDLEPVSAYWTDEGLRLSIKNNGNSAYIGSFTVALYDLDGQSYVDYHTFNGTIYVGGSITNEIIHTLYGSADHYPNLRIKVDYNNKIKETNEYNNNLTYHFKDASKNIDLEPTGAVWTNGGLDLIISNNGSDDYNGSFMVSLRDLDGGTYVDYYSFSALIPAQSSVSKIINNSYGSSSTYPNLNIEVDRDNSVLEANENNNNLEYHYQTGSVLITDTDKKSDLVIRDIYRDGPLLRATYCNIGTGMQKNRFGTGDWFYIKMTANNKIHTGKSDSSNYVSLVPEPGECHNTEGYLTSYFDLQDGLYEVTAQIDWEGAIVESNENNNILAKTIIAGVDELQGKIYEVQAKNITANSAIVYFKTDQLVVSHIQYGMEDTANGRNLVAYNKIASRDHQINLNNLAPGSIYYYRISADGQEIGSRSFATLGQVLISPVVPQPSLPPSGEISQRLSGRLLLAVEDKGKIFYVYPQDLKKYEVTFGNVLTLFQTLALGVNDADINQILINPSSVSADKDSDGDGYNDKEEVMNGYNPEIASDPANRGNDLVNVNTKLSNRLVGKLLLQVDDRGRIWYVDQGAKRWEVTFGNVINLFTSLALGITNDDLAKIEDGN